MSRYKWLVAMAVVAMAAVTGCGGGKSAKHENNQSAFEDSQDRKEQAGEATELTGISRRSVSYARQEARAKEQNSGYQAQLEQLDKIPGTMTKLSEVNTEVATLKAQNADLKNQVIMANGQNADLAAKLDAANGKIADLVAKLDAANTEVTNLKRAKDVAATLADGLGKQLAGAEATIKELKARLGEERAEVKRLLPVATALEAGQPLSEAMLATSMTIGAETKVAPTAPTGPVRTAHEARVATDRSATPPPAPTPSAEELREEIAEIEEAIAHTERDRDNCKAAVKTAYSKEARKLAEEGAQADERALKRLRDKLTGKQAQLAAIRPRAK